MAEPEKPHWWSNIHDLSWGKVKAAMVEDWHKLAGGMQKLEKNVAESAIQLGHGAREVYKKFGTWGSELEAALKKDWEATHKDASQAWEKVRDAVKHGWEKTQNKGG
jgi:hypothetical protein